jgi:hypothetical protein
MDIARPEIKRKKIIRRYIYAGAGVVAAVLVTAALARLKPAAPGVDRSTIWTDTVKRGRKLFRWCRRCPRDASKSDSFYQAQL